MSPLSSAPLRAARDGDGPSREQWEIASPFDRTNEGGRELAGGNYDHHRASKRLGWVQVSHSSRVRASLLWMYAADNSSVWYDAGKAFVVQDAVDLFRWLGVEFVPPGTSQKAAVLRTASTKLRQAGYDTIVFMSHIDGCNATLLPILRHGCWAKGKRVVELVSLHPFRLVCPVSARFKRGRLIGRDDASSGGKRDGGTSVARLCTCTCTERSPSSYDIGTGVQGDVIC